MARKNERLRVNDFYQVEYDRLVAENNRLKILVAEAADKFHVLSFYIKDAQARDLCEKKSLEMSNGSKGVIYDFQVKQLYQGQ